MFNMLLRPNKKSNIYVTMEVPGREYSGKAGDPNGPLYMCKKDGYVVFHRSELMCGSLNLSLL